MNRLMLSVATGLSLTLSGFAGEVAAPELQVSEDTPLNILKLGSSFTGGSEIRFTSKGQGRGDAFRNDFQYLRLFPIQGPWHWHVGANYERLDFGGPAHGPLPSMLQSFSLPIGISYLVDGQVGFLFQIRPGFYFERDISSGAFDIPVLIGGGIPLIEGELYGVWGVGAVWHRRYPVLPLLGLKWKINDRVDLVAYLPEPRLEVKVTDNLRTWVGGEIISGSYKVGKRKKKELSGTILDYEDYRVGAGVIYSPAKDWELLVGGGYSVLRNMYFWRANQDYKADPAPFVRVQLSAAF